MLACQWWRYRECRPVAYRTHFTIPPKGCAVAGFRTAYNGSRYSPCSNHLSRHETTHTTQRRECRGLCSAAITIIVVPTACLPRGLVAPSHAKPEQAGPHETVLNKGNAAKLFHQRSSWRWQRTASRYVVKWN